MKSLNDNIKRIANPYNSLLQIANSERRDFGNKFINLLICFIFAISCTPPKSHNITISKDMLYGEWALIGGEEQVNYPYAEFFNDNSAILHSHADTIYRFTFFIRRDSLHLVDIYGKEYVNKIAELNDKTVIFEGIADVNKTQIYKK